jgi:hypothetical protein
MFDEVCGWGSDTTSCAVGYDMMSKSGRTEGVIEGCSSSETGERFRLVVPEGGLALGTYANIALEVGIFWSFPEETSVTFTRVDVVGGIVEGTFDTVLYQLDDERPSTGSFRVVRVAPVLAP